MGKEINTNSKANRSRVGLFWIALGITLIILSWTPIGRIASRSMWTNDDSATYSKLRQQLHRAEYQSPERAGITEAQMKSQQEKMKRRAEKMREKLEYAQSQPKLWSRYFLWVGILLAAAGSLGTFASNQK